MSIDLYKYHTVWYQFSSQKSCQLGSVTVTYPIGLTVPYRVSLNYT